MKLEIIINDQTELQYFRQTLLEIIYKLSQSEKSNQDKYLLVIKNPTFILSVVKSQVSPFSRNIIMGAARKMLCP